jgi:hypothetical protein
LTIDSTRTLDAALAAKPEPVELESGDFLLGTRSGLVQKYTPAIVATALATLVGSALIDDAITNGVTTRAPSQNAVFDALALKAPLASPALTGNPTAPTQTAGNSSTRLATTAFVAGEIATAISGLASVYQPLDSDLTSWASVSRASGFDTFVATPSSANLAALVTNETGSGALVFGTSPSLSTPTIAGAALSGSLTGTPTVASSWTWSSVQLFPTVNIGNADTTLSRSAAGVLAVEGKNVVTNGSNSSPATATIDIGVVPTFEDFELSGVAAWNLNKQLFISSKYGRGGGAADVADVAINRQAVYTGGTGAFVNSALKVNTTTTAGQAAYEWASLFVLDNYGTSGDGSQNVAGYFQSYKRSTGFTWCLATEMFDFDDNPAAPTVGVEVAMRTVGGDSSRMRVGVHIIGSSQDGNATTQGDLLRLSVADANTTIDRAINLDGNTGDYNYLLWSEAVKITGAGLTTIANTLEINVSGSTVAAVEADDIIIRRQNSSAGMSIFSSTTGSCSIYLGDSTDSSLGGIIYRASSHSSAGDMQIFCNNTTRLFWDQSDTQWEITGGLAISSTLTLGASGGTHSTRHAVNDQGIVISGGNADTSGASIVLTGGTAAFAAVGALRSGSTNIMNWNSSRAQMETLFQLWAPTVGGLPSAASAGNGAIAFVTDATATTFASIVAGGGSNRVPVYSDGTNWRIG